MCVRKDSSVKPFRIIDQNGAGGLAGVTVVVEVLQAEGLDGVPVAVAVQAVAGVGLQPTGGFQVKQPSLGGTVMHLDQEPTGWLIEIHGEVGGLFVERPGPVVKAAAEAGTADVAAENGVRARSGLEAVVPVALNFFLSIVPFEVGKKLAVGRDKLCAGNHRSTLF